MVGRDFSGLRLPGELSGPPVASCLKPRGSLQGLPYLLIENYDFTHNIADVFAGRTIGAEDDETCDHQDRLSTTFQKGVDDIERTISRGLR